MTAVQLTTVVLNDAEDPSDQLVLSRMTKYQRQVGKLGRVQAVAGGGRRAIVSAGQHQDWTLNVSKADRSTVDWIEAHVGRVVAIRDDAGHKLFGVYLSVPVEEVPWPRTASFDLELAEVSWSEAV